jgi:hypothetical protein
MQSIVGFIPLICKIFFKKQPSWFPYFYTSVNIKLFLSINIISSLGLIFNKEIGFFIDYLLDINSLYELKEHADVILDTDSLKNEVIHIDLDDPKTAKFNKKIMQAVVLCTTISIIYLSMSSF